MKRIDTMSIRDILRHHHDLGLPRAEIAVAVNVSAGTVSNVLERAQAAGLSWPLPCDLDDDGLRAQLCPPSPRRRLQRQTCNHRHRSASLLRRAAVLSPGASGRPECGSRRKAG